MKKFLIRAGISPLDNATAERTLVNNTIGGNVGNLLYGHGIMRTLTTSPDVEFTPTYHTVGWHGMSAEEINEKFDCFVIPLADAFREKFVGELQRLTTLIGKLKIPCIVIGAGLRAPLPEKEKITHFPFDNEVKVFIKTVLKKSALVGVRGELTGKYLERLGFREGRDFEAIGCPSMYGFGRNISIRDTDITENSRVCVNSTVFATQKDLKFIRSNMERFQNAYFLPQYRKELELVFLGNEFKTSQKQYYPTKATDAAYQNGRMKFFCNVPTWFDFLRTVDFSFGARLHGNIAATLVGTPNIMIVKDLRMRELADYHGLCHVDTSEIKEDTDIFSLIEKADFHCAEKKQAENLSRYTAFLEKNGLDHIYKGGADGAEAPFDEKLRSISLTQPVEPVSQLSTEQQLERWQAYAKELRRRHNKAEEATLSDLIKELLDNRSYIAALAVQKGMSRVKKRFSRHKQ